jgi:ABC-2 type transport system ATP-binding protein
MAPAIKVENLSKTFSVQKKEPGLWNSVKGLIHPVYQKVDAVQKVSFSIEEGELVGFLGPNGAGKTTTLKMLAGLLYPDTGKASVMGYVPWERKENYRRLFSLVMGQKYQLWWDLPAMESLLLNKEIYGVEENKYQTIVNELTDILDVKDKLHIPVRELSLGERMKMELIAALLFSPKVIFLDEPTIGLDVVSQKKVRDFIRFYNTQNKATILLTSHYMSDIEELCSRVIIIDHGKILYDGGLQGILERFADSKLITLMLENPVDSRDIESFGEIILNEGEKLILKIKRESVSRVSADLLNKLTVKDLTIEEPPIEDVIRDIFGNASRI